MTDIARDGGRSMEITFLGHAGFVAETDEAIVVMDPWFSPRGAFDAAWFQYPRNHHLAGLVREKLADETRRRYVYVSHEHGDHFDPEFLESLPVRDFTLVVPRFEGGRLRAILDRYRCAETVWCGDGDHVDIPGGRVTVFVDDHGLNRDSAVLLQAGGRTFLNLNDCKINERVGAIARRHGRIDVFTCQFSGASWHPTSYTYAPDIYDAISRSKMLSKLETVARTVAAARPRIYLTSAGPPVFLDPTLLHVNLEPVNIFPRASRCIEFLQRRLRPGFASYLDLTPGDILDVASGEVTSGGKRDDIFERALYRYAAEYRDFFARRQKDESRAVPADIVEQLADALAAKLPLLTLHREVPAPLYMGVSEVPDVRLRVDFRSRRIERTRRIRDEAFYAVTAPGGALARTLRGELTWEELALSMRLRFKRSPDVYSTVLQGFLLLEAKDLPVFCTKLAAMRERTERVTVEAGGRRFTIDRYCPHQGGDMSRGWVEDGRYVVCPRHRWRFDLFDGGRCTTSDVCVSAVEVEPAPAREARVA
jgi:UDP-MurNAc hydroxylase